MKQCVKLFYIMKALWIVYLSIGSVGNEGDDGVTSSGSGLSMQKVNQEVLSILWNILEGNNC